MEEIEAFALQAVAISRKLLRPTSQPCKITSAGDWFKVVS